MAAGHHTDKWFEDQNKATGQPKGARHSDEWYRTHQTAAAPPPPPSSPPPGQYLPGQGPPPANRQADYQAFLSQAQQLNPQFNISFAQYQQALAQGGLTGLTGYQMATMPTSQFQQFFNQVQQGHVGVVQQQATQQQQQAAAQAEAAAADAAAAQAAQQQAAADATAAAALAQTQMEARRDGWDKANNQGIHDADGWQSIGYQADPIAMPSWWDGPGASTAAPPPPPAAPPPPPPAPPAPGDLLAGGGAAGAPVSSLFPGGGTTGAPFTGLTPPAPPAPGNLLANPPPGAPFTGLTPPAAGDLLAPTTSPRDGSPMTGPLLTGAAGWVPNTAVGVAPTTSPRDGSPMTGPLTQTGAWNRNASNSGGTPNALAQLFGQPGGHSSKQSGQSNWGAWGQGPSIAQGAWQAEGAPQSWTQPTRESRSGFGTPDQGLPSWAQNRTRSGTSAPMGPVPNWAKNRTQKAVPWGQPSGTWGSGGL